MGNFLPDPITTKDSRDLENSFCRVGFSSMQGWRDAMEDSHVIIPSFHNDLALFAIFDGHGGKQIAQFCEARFASELLKNPNMPIGNYQLALEQTFLRMDQLLFSMEEYKNVTPDSPPLPGTTALVVLATPSQIVCASVGDSRACVVLKDGSIISLARDHKPEDEEERARIEWAGGVVKDGRVNNHLNMSRAIGDLQMKADPRLRQEDQLISAVPRVVTIPIGAEEKKVKFLVMGCDGIWEKFSEEMICRQIEQKLGQRMGSSWILEQLFNQILAPDLLEELGKDNMSAAIVEFK